jgi:DNA replication protein DnaC
MRRPAPLSLPTKPSPTRQFHDPIIVTAFLDRLLHHSVVINMRGNSYRLRGKVGKEGVEISQS